MPGRGAGDSAGGVDDRGAVEVELVAGGVGPSVDSYVDQLARSESAFSRRSVLLGAAATAAGLAVGAWWAARDRSTAPPLRRTGPPTALWVHRTADARATLGDATLPLIATAAELLLLDPQSGRVRLRIPLPAGATAPLLADGRAYVPSADGTVTAYGLHDGTTPLWRATVPGPVALDCRTADAVHARTTPSPTSRAPAGEAVLLALGANDGRLRWQRPANVTGGSLTGVTGVTSGSAAALAGLPDGRLLVARSSRDEVVALHAADGSPLWTVPADQALDWLETDPDRVYLATRGGGLRAIRSADGTAGWALPRETESDARCLRPLSADGALFVPREDGVVSRHSAADGSRLWSCRLPFRLDHRSRPLLAGGALYVPGPHTAGVAAVDAATGTLRWTYRSPDPGSAAWHLAADATHLYAGHDTALHALPLT